MAALSLNQIIQRLESLALSHKQINHFFIGNIDEFLDSEDVTYPACFLELKQGSISKTDKKTYFNFKVYFLDLLDIAENSLRNEWEVKSDLVSVAQDYLAMIGYSGYQNDWQVSTDNNLQILDYQLQDLTAGVSIDLSISTSFLSNRCQVPAIGVTFESPQDSSGVPLWYDANYIGNYIYKANGNEGNTITIPSLKNRGILIVQQGDKMLDNTMYNYDVTTGTFTFTYDLQPDQVLQILNRNKV